MTSTKQFLGLSALLIGSALGTSVAQVAPAPAAQTPPIQVDPAHASMNPDDSGSYATGKPLEMQSKEGFWGHMNPFARKKWVHRQIDPIKDRDNELDQLQAKNANDIRDVDARATAGINNAMMAANTANQVATDAGSRANAAGTLAGNADNRTTALNGTVSNLDQYSPVTSEALPFVAGRTTLGPKAKSELDELADKLGTEKGYIVEVQGYSRGGVQTSQAMADAVVRYLVTAHQVPVYRIYREGLGNAKQVALADGEKPLPNGVRVTLLHNSLATMDQPSGPTATNGAPQPSPVSGALNTGVSTPGTN